MVWWWLVLAAAGPAKVVAVGDAPALAQPGAMSRAAAPMSWVAVLDDCLQEARPSAFSVIDRTRAGDDSLALQEQVGALRALEPEVLVVVLSDTEQGGAERLAATLDLLAPPGLPLVLLAPPDLVAQPRFAGVFSSRPEARLVALADAVSDADWRPDRGLSAQDHVAVGARVCALVGEVVGPELSAPRAKSE